MQLCRITLYERHRVVAYFARQIMESTSNHGQYVCWYIESFLSGGRNRTGHALPFFKHMESSLFSFRSLESVLTIFERIIYSQALAFWILKLTLHVTKQQFGPHLNKPSEPTAKTLSKENNVMMIFRNIQISVVLITNLTVSRKTATAPKTLIV